MSTQSTTSAWSDDYSYESGQEDEHESDQELSTGEAAVDQSEAAAQEQNGPADGGDEMPTEPPGLFKQSSWEALSRMLAMVS